MYQYGEVKERLFNDEGQRMFLRVRDCVRNRLAMAGAVRMDEAISNACGGDSWTMLACVDRLVELGEIREILSKMCLDNIVFLLRLKYGHRVKLQSCILTFSDNRFVRALRAAICTAQRTAPGTFWQGGTGFPVLETPEKRWKPRVY